MTLRTHLKFNILKIRIAWKKRDFSAEENFLQLNRFLIVTETQFMHIFLYKKHSVYSFSEDKVLKTSSKEKIMYKLYQYEKFNLITTECRQKIFF